MPAQTTLPPATAPARVLGPFDATCIVIGAIIGVGIFFNPSRVASLTESGTLALGAWALAGFIALCGGLAFAALGQRYHASGAQYQALRDSYGPCPAFLFVFCNATAIQAGAIGVIALVCAANLLSLAGHTEPPAALSLSVALGLIALVTAANIIGVKWGSRLQNLTVTAKVIALLAIVALAAFAAPDAPFPAPPAPRPNSKAVPGFGGVIAALVPAFFAYGGWQHALWISGEVREPRRNLPRAIVTGMIIVVAVYLAANWAYLVLLGHSGVASSKALAADSVATVFPGWGRRAIAAAVAISALGVLNAQLLSGPRLVYGMAADGRFFSLFARLHPRFQTPAAAIALLGLVGAALLTAVGAGGIDTLTAGAVFVDGIFFVLTGIAVLRLHATPDAPLLPGAKIAAALFVLGAAGVLIGAFLAADARHAAIGGLAWIAGAAVVYTIWFRRRPA
jgi:basic amino acid/polyamine antiporter, APA family